MWAFCGWDVTSYLLPQRSRAPWFWTPTGSSATLTPRPSMRSSWKQEIWWKLWRNVQMVRKGRSLRLTFSRPAWLHLLLEWSFVFAGWWFCQCETVLGWVPASYLEPLDTPEEPEEAEPNYAGKWPGSRSDNGWPKHKTREGLTIYTFRIKTNFLWMVLEVLDVQ